MCGWKSGADIPYAVAALLVSGNLHIELCKRERNNPLDLLALSGNRFHALVDWSIIILLTAMLADPGGHVLYVDGITPKRNRASTLRSSTGSEHISQPYPAYSLVVSLIAGYPSGSSKGRAQTRHGTRQTCLYFARLPFGRFGSGAPCYLDQGSKCLVDRLRIVEALGNIKVEHDYVCARSVARRVLSAQPNAQVVFARPVRVNVDVRFLLHSLSAVSVYISPVGTVK